MADKEGSTEKNSARASAIVSGARVALDPNGEGTMPCDPLNAQLRIDIADLALPLNGHVAVGQPWSDSLANDICVAGIPGRAQSWRRFDPIGDTTLAGERAIVVMRTDSIAASASGTLDQHVLSLTGAGHATVRIYLSETSGKVVRVWKEQLLNVSVISSGRTRVFVQQSTSVAEVAR